MSITCPRCKTINEDSAVFCTSCGYSLEGLAPSAPTPPVAPTYASQNPGNVSANVPNMIGTRYKTLRVISTFFTVLAWVFLVMSVLAGIVGAISGSDYYGGLGFFGVLGGILAGGLMFAMFKAYAELLHIAIDIEENTRLTAELLKRR